MKKFRLTFLAVITLLFLACAGRNDNGGFENNANSDSQDNPAPVLTALEPGAVLINCSDFILTARGSDFVEDAVIVYRGEEMNTTRVSESELSCSITRELTQSAGPVLVKVRNPAPGGGDSPALPLKIRKNPFFGTPLILAENAFWNGLAASEDGQLHAWYTDTDEADIQWEDKTAAFAIRSNDQGQSWTDPVQLNLTGAPQYPCLCPGTDGRIAAVWVAQIGWTRVFKLSRDHGSSWPRGKQIGSNSLLGTPYAGSGTPVQCCFSADGTIHVAFGWYHAETWPDTVYYLRSEDYGSHWQYKQITDDGFMDIDQTGLQEWGNRRTPVIDCADGYVYVMYREHFPQTVRFRYNYHSMFLRSQNNGRNWTAPQRISENRSSALFPNTGLKAGPNGVVAAMWDSVLRISTDHGATWKNEIQLYTGSGLMTGADLVFDRVGNLMVLGNKDGSIFFRRSTDNGSTWSVPVTVTQTGNCSNSRLVVTPDSKIFVSWLCNDKIHFVQGIPE